MRAPFTDVLRHEPLCALLVAVLGPDVRCDQLASDTPLGVGSTYRESLQGHARICHKAQTQNVLFS